MKTIIAGSREIVDYEVVKKAISSSEFNITAIISGAARGVDALGERYATENKIPLIKKPANWNLYGKSAGYKRNEEMAKEADALIAIWDGKSKGTFNMINIARMRGLKIYVEKV